MFKLFAKKRSSKEKLAALRASVKELKAENAELKSKLEELTSPESHILSDGYVAPPRHLRLRVSGVEDLMQFAALGKKLTQDISDILNKAGLDPATMKHVLDWGCGCGRVTQQLPGLFPKSRVTGFDIDSEAIAWDQKKLASFADFQLIPDKPPINVPDAAFDFVLGLSVFTHLPLELEEAWLTELARLVKPGGYALLTYHDESLIPSNAKDEHLLQNVDGFFYFQFGETRGLPSYYLTSYHSQAAIHRLWGRHFEVMGLFPRSINHHQCAALLKRSPA